MKGKIIGSLLVTLTVFLLLASSAWSFSYSYDEENETLYAGGAYYSNTIYMANDMKSEKYLYLENRIYKVNLKENKSELFIKTDEFIFGHELSATGDLALITGSEKKQKLLIYNRKGEKIHEIGNVPAYNYRKYFQWGPDGSKVIFLTGGINRITELPFSPLVIFDVQNATTKKTNYEFVDMDWSKYDGNIYLRRSHHDTSLIYKYNPSTDEGEWTKRKGFKFSSDGKYYIGTVEGYAEEGPPPEKYVLYTASDDKVLKELKVLGGNLLFIGYSNDLLHVSAMGMYNIYDSKTQSFRGLVTKKVILGWNKDMTKVVVYEGGDKIHIEELLTGKRLKSIDIPK